MKVKYYETKAGNCPIREFIDELSYLLQEELVEAIDVLESGEILKMPLSKPLYNVYRGLNELRLKDNSGNYRIFYYIKVKDGIYFLHGFKKKTQKTPQRELKIAVKRLKEIR